ncbi:tail tape measure [Caudoviricetes sp.]|nr:tail tape measure [Caudoviricetes sp.]
MNEQVVLEIKDKVAPTISHSIDKIDRAATHTQTAVDRLQKSLSKLDVGRLKQIASITSTASSALEKLSKAESRHSDAATKAAIAEQRLIATKARTVAANNAAAMSELRLAAAIARSNAAKDRASLATARQNRQMGAPRAPVASSGGGGGLLGGTRAFVGMGMGSGGMGAGVGAMLSGGAGLAAGGLMALKGAASEIIEYADSYRQLQNRLQNVTGSLATTGGLIDDITKVANRTAQPVNDTAEAFARFDRVLKPLGKTQAESLQFTETLQTMLLKFGKSGSEAASATLQLTQAMGKGKLDGDEFRSVMENLPELGTEIAKVLGVTRGELLKLAPQGKITGDVIYQAMTNAKKTVDGMPQPLETVDMAFTRLKNNATQFFGELPLGTALITAFTGAIDGLSKALEKTDNIDNIADRVVKLKKEAEEAAKNVSTPGNDAAKRDAERAAKRAEEAKKVRDLTFDTEASLDRQIQLAQMDDRQKAIEIAKDQLILQAQKDKINLHAADLDTVARKTGQLYDLEQKRQKVREKRNPEENRATVIAKINAELDNEITRTYMLADARDAQARFDRINETLMGKRITLTEDESATIRRKIENVRDLALVQREFDAIVDESIGPIRAYTSTLDGARIALDAGQISADRYTRILNRAAEEYKTATSLSYEFNRNLSEQTRLANLGGKQREVEGQILARVNELRSAGVELSYGEIDALREKFLLLQKVNAEQAARDAIRAETTGQREQTALTIGAISSQANAIGPGGVAQATMSVAGENLALTKTWYAALIQQERDYYATIDQLRQENLISEREAETAKMRARLSTQNTILDGAKSYFSNFEGMQRSNINEMAAIGKAAAIANATISMYQSANAAYASMAGIPGVGPALGATAAAGAIASGMANIAAIAAQPTGFKTGGYTGNMGPNDVAGVVHGREYVFDANSTSRIGVENLEAMRKGGSPSVGTGGGSSGTPIALNVIVVSSQDEAKSVAAQQKGDTVVIDAIGRNSRQIKRMLGV